MGWVKSPSNTTAAAIYSDGDRIMVMPSHISMDSLLTYLCLAVRRRCTSTWSLSATSIPENPPPPVSSADPLYTHTYLGHGSDIHIGHLIYKCGGIDKRTIEKFEKVSVSHFSFSSHQHHHHLIAWNCPSVGLQHIFAPAFFTLASAPHWWTTTTTPSSSIATFNSLHFNDFFILSCLSSW